MSECLVSEGLDGRRHRGKKSTLDTLVIELVLGLELTTLDGSHKSLVHVSLHCIRQDSNALAVDRGGTAELEGYHRHAREAALQMLLVGSDGVAEGVDLGGEVL